MKANISVIIPARNEKQNLERLLPTLMQTEGIQEVIIADGQSDPSQLPGEIPGVSVISTDKGRAVQMNAGAKCASGDIFWFLHADSQPDPDAGLAIQSAIAEGFDGGCFSLYFHDATSPLLRYIARNSNRRAKYLRLMFGDQGIFVTRTFFERAGGYPVQDLMEDWEFSLTLYREGRVFVLDTPIGTSARRFIENGTLRTLLYMHSLKIRYVLGVHPSRLAKNYGEPKS